MNSHRRFLLVLVALTVGAGALAPLALGIQLVSGREPTRAPQSAEDMEERWDAILDGAVSHGRLDYAFLNQRRDDLAEFIGALGIFGPTTAPDAFLERGAKFAYYINAYNALVIHAVLQQSVRRSVHEVRGLVEPTPGMGFFWAQRFCLDGALVSLHGLEHEILRARFADARLHAAIVCASASCPSLAPDAYRAISLDAQLATAARDFASEPRHVRVDHDARVVELSSIYEWYAADFASHAETLSGEASVLSWIAIHAHDPSAIERARRDAYAIRYIDYDWRLNGHW